VSSPDLRHFGADRNLLFGILALQLDFVPRDALIQAMNAWVLDKSRGLGQILIDQGALSSDRHALLEALVQEHLKQHSNDAEKSLAALSSVGSVRDQLQNLKDPELGETLAHLTSKDAEQSTVDWPSPGVPTSAGGRFRILRPHAKGGLGEVFVARDEELHREVALKQIQETHADNPQSRSRFVLEAEITGGLEHPGIVPVYGLGTYDDGRPFYAMRFIKGDSLKDAIERYHGTDGNGLEPGERSLEFRKLLGRFVDVCNAIAYAHSRGVLHRDLKPGNIMLGPYGETLVVDWGLAKPVGRPEKELGAEATLRPPSASGSAQTQAGAALGTPAYMSPEQAAGKLDDLGPASDVYSLGATLYCLLTGKPPVHELDLATAISKVQAGDIRRPRDVNPEVPRALEAVCLRAMSLWPKGRYQSPRELADDIEHWLADEPVSTYREPSWERFRRWRRRHSRLIGGSLAAMVTAILAMTFVAVREVERRKESIKAQVRIEHLERAARVLGDEASPPRARSGKTVIDFQLRLPKCIASEPDRDPVNDVLWRFPARRGCAFRSMYLAVSTEMDRDTFWQEIQMPFMPVDLSRITQVTKTPLDGPALSYEFDSRTVMDRERENNFFMYVYSPALPKQSNGPTVSKGARIGVVFVVAKAPNPAIQEAMDMCLKTLVVR
jgi:serine/threonine protein kinase